MSSKTKPKQFQTRNQNVKTRNEEIRAFYKKRFHQDKIRTEVILDELHKRYHLSPDTLWAIINRTGNYADI